MVEYRPEPGDMRGPGTTAAAQDVGAVVAPGPGVAREGLRIEIVAQRQGLGRIGLQSVVSCLALA